MDNKILTWQGRLKKLRMRQGVFCAQVPISQSYFSDLCVGRAKNPSLQLYARIESLLTAMERRVEQEAEARERKDAPPVKKPKKDRARPKLTKGK